MQFYCKLQYITEIDEN